MKSVNNKIVNDHNIADKYSARDTVMRIADQHSTNVRKHNLRMALVVLLPAVLIALSIFLIHSVFAWPNALPHVGIVPHFILFTIFLFILVLIVSRQWRLFWTIESEARKIGDRAGCPNLILSILDYDVGGMSGLARARQNCPQRLHILCPDTPILRVFKVMGRKIFSFKS